MEWTWADIEGRVRQAADAGAVRLRDMVLRDAEYMCINKPGHESPIEAIFEAWWNALKWTHGGMEDMHLEPQREIEIEGEKFRADFVVAMGSHPAMYGADVWTKFPKLAIELDGHDFHERTKEQVTYRNRRDRQMTLHGWTVLHVSGSELFRAPEDALEDIFRHADRVLSEFWRQYWKDYLVMRQKQGEVARDVRSVTEHA